MDQEEFKRKLSEVSEWVIPDTTREITLNQKRKHRKKLSQAQQEPLEQQEQDDVDDVDDDDEQEQDVVVVNTTYAPVVVNLVIKPVDCEDCGKHCAKGRRLEAKFYQYGDRQMWRQFCNTCSKYKNPYTGKFDVNGQLAANVFNNYIRNRSIYLNTKAWRKQAELDAGSSSTVVENDHSTIIYHHKKQPT
jgi:predicted Zn-ribbon and HTH transcriptional regulator